MGQTPSSGIFSNYLFIKEERRMKQGWAQKDIQGWPVLLQAQYLF